MTRSFYDAAEETPAERERQRAADVRAHQSKRAEAGPPDQACEGDRGGDSCEASQRQTGRKEQVRAVQTGRARPGCRCCSNISRISRTLVASSGFLSSVRSETMRGKRNANPGWSPVMPAV